MDSGAQEPVRGPSVSGGMSSILVGGAPAVFPEPQAWVARHFHDVLRRHGWEFQPCAGLPALTWDEALTPSPGDDPAPRGRIRGHCEHVGRRCTFARICAASPLGATRDNALVIELDPLVIDEAPSADAAHVPTVHGGTRPSVAC